MISIDYPLAMRYLIYCLSQDRSFSLDPDRCYYDLDDVHGQRLLRFRYPLCTPVGTDLIRAINLEPYVLKPPSYAIILIQAGNAALATVVDGKITHHKVISKYVTRKKQGKAQINYLKTKGKSRAGSRIRLANTRLFFDEVIEWLKRWINPETNVLLYNFTPMIWGLFFSSKQKPPFSKDDIRLRKIPIDVRKPRFKGLQYVKNQLEMGYIELTPMEANPYEKEIQNLWDGKIETCI